MMGVFSVIRTILALSFFSLTSYAVAETIETAPGDDDNEITVIGPKSIKDAVGKYIDTTIATPHGGHNNGQYARYAEPICPVAFGFSDENNLAIAKRIRGVALAADIKVGDANCTPNVYVVVIDDGRSAVEMLRKKHHRIFGNLPIPKREMLAESTGPTFAWQVTATIPAGGGDIIASYGANQSDTTVLPGGTRSTMISRLRLPYEAAIAASYLLLEKKSLVGLTTVQIADYAAMSSLIETSDVSRRDSNPSSILSLFNDRKEKSDLPERVNDWDLILLHAVYASTGNVWARMQRSEIQQRFVNEITVAQTQGK